MSISDETGVELDPTAEAMWALFNPTDDPITFGAAAAVGKVEKSCLHVRRAPGPRQGLAIARNFLSPAISIYGQKTVKYSLIPLSARDVSLIWKWNSKRKMVPPYLCC